VSNVLIVESENDKYFVEALIEHWQYANITLNSPICSIDDSMKKAIYNFDSPILDKFKQFLCLF